MNNRTKLILLGTGTPVMTPGRYQSSLAIVVDDTPYIVDCGSGVLERLSEARAKGVSGLENEKLEHLFITHFHPDHTLGLPGFLIAPWNMKRRQVNVFGSKGLRSIVDQIMTAYRPGIEEHLFHGPKTLEEPVINVTEFTAGVIHKDEKVTVEAISVSHGTFDAYAFKFTTPDKVIVISGDTTPVPQLYEAAKNCDILVHEVFCENAVKDMAENYEKYFKEVHTGSIELGKVAEEANPGLLVLTHQISYHKGEDEIIKDVKKNYTGKLAYGNDLDVFE